MFKEEKGGLCMQIGVRDGRVMGKRAERWWCLRSSRHWRDFGFSSDEMEAIGELEPKSAIQIL